MNDDELIPYVCSHCEHAGHIPKDLKCIPTCKGCLRVIALSDMHREVKT